MARGVGEEAARADGRRGGGAASEAAAEHCGGGDVRIGRKTEEGPRGGEKDAVVLGPRGENVLREVESAQEVGVGNEAAQIVRAQSTEGSCLAKYSQRAASGMPTGR